MSSNTKKKVVIVGGGIAGLSAAHHLLTKGENKFEVHIIERREFGGKARSQESNGLPTEHGFRFFPGFYKHITKTMDEIPSDGKSVVNGSVYKNNLVQADHYTFLYTEHNQKGIVEIPLSLSNPFKFFRAYRKMKKQMVTADVDITDLGKKQLINKMLEVYCTCNARIEGEYDNISWSEFLDDDNPQYGKDFKQLFATGISKNLVAVRADIANSRTGAKLVGHMIWHMVNPFAKHPDKLLNGPTSKMWIEPWVKYLQEKGVKIIADSRAVYYEYCMKEKKMSKVWYDDTTPKDGPKDYSNTEVLKTVGKKIEADYFISALPLEKFDDIVERVKTMNRNTPFPYFDNIRQIRSKLNWMNGILFYFDCKIDISQGHITVIDNPAAITLISQTQFWKDYLNKNPINYKGKEVKAILSVICSDFDACTKEGTKLRDLTVEQFKEEIKEILFSCSYGSGKLDEYKSNLLTMELDNSLVNFDPNQRNPIDYPDPKALPGLFNKEPLFVNQIRTYGLRPTVHTPFSNFFIASDYVKTNSDLGCMDSADEAARRAVNNIFVAEGINVRCKIDSYELPSFFGLFKSARFFDYQKFNRGERFSFGTNYPAKIARKLIELFSKILFSKYNQLFTCLLLIIWAIGFLVVAGFNYFYRTLYRLFYEEYV